MSLLHGDFVLFPCSASDQGVEEFLLDGVFCFYTRIPIDIVFKLLKDFEEVWIKMATVSSRDILKMFAQCRSELEVGPSGLIALNLFPEKGRIPSHEKRYTVTVRFANLIAHTADLATVYHLLIQPEFHSVTLTDLAKEHPIHADSINRLTPSEVVTLLVGFPEPRIKRAVERNAVFDVLDQYFHLRLECTDEPLLQLIENSSIWADRGRYMMLDLRSGQTVREIVVAALTEIDDSIDGSSAKPSRLMIVELARFMDRLLRKMTPPSMIAQSGLTNPPKPAPGQASPAVSSPTPPERRFFSTLASIPRPRPSSSRGPLLRFPAPRPRALFLHPLPTALLRFRRFKF